jgi:hypothetical protein
MLGPMKAPTRRSQGALLTAVFAGTGAIIAVGRGAPSLVFIPLVAGTFAAYALLVRSLSRARLVESRTLVAACIALMIFAIAVPARSSKDVYAYILYGRIVAQHHVSPYTHLPADFPDDPALQHVQGAFRGTGSVYGPLFTAVSAAGMSVCGASALCGRAFFQAIEALAVLCCAWLVLRATRSWAAFVCVAFNPVLLASIVNGGHNDGLVAAALLAAVLIARTKPAVAGLLLAAAILVKVNALLPAAVLIVWLFVRDEKRKAITLAAVIGVLVAAAYLIAGGTAALGPLHHTAEVVSFHSFWYPLERLFGIGSTRLAPIALAICIVIALAVAAGRLRDHGPAAVVGVALTVYVLAGPNILPWYTAPVIPLLALHYRSRTTWAILAYSTLLNLVYPARFPVHHTLTGLILPETARNVLPVVQVVWVGAIAYAIWRQRRLVMIDSLGVGAG